MTVTHFNPGDEVDALSVAGEAFDAYEQDGIRADVFTLPDVYQIPLIQSVAPGSGKLDLFLDALRRELTDRPIRFVSVINQRLARHLVEHGFAVE